MANNCNLTISSFEILLQVFGWVAAGQEDCVFESKIILGIVGLLAALDRFEINKFICLTAI